MKTRVALLGIIVEDRKAAEEINRILHDVSDYVVGRMGVPYRERKINIMSIILDAPEDVISAVSGKLGQIDGVTSKTVYAKIED